MKPFQIKTLVAVMAIAGFTSACDRDDPRRQGYVPPEPPAVERSTTAPGTTSPDALQSLNENGYARSAESAGKSSDIAHQETVQFSGIELTDKAEERLEGLVEELDKDKPVAVTIALEGSNLAEGSQAPRDTADAGNSGMAENAAVLAQRVDRIRAFMEEQGVEVVQWQFEGMEPQQPAQQQSLQEDVQHVRLVIVPAQGADGISAL